jgi:hypothetical protein
LLTIDINRTIRMVRNSTISACASPLDGCGEKSRARQCEKWNHFAGKCIGLIETFAEFGR